LAWLEPQKLNFNGGELSPALQGRTDLERYETGAALLRNFIARPQGGAYKRPGTRLVADLGWNQGRPVRLMPFRFSTEQSYLLVFGHQKMRVLMDGGEVCWPETWVDEGVEKPHPQAGQEVEIWTPWTAEDAQALNAAQTADTLYLVHPGYRPRTLTRFEHWDWRLSAWGGDGDLPAPDGLAVTKSGYDGAQYLVTAWKTAGGEGPPSDPVEAEVLLAFELEGRTFNEVYDWLRAQPGARAQGYIPDYCDYAAKSAFHIRELLRTACPTSSWGQDTVSSGSRIEWPHVSQPYHAGARLRLVCRHVPNSGGTQDAWGPGSAATPFVTTTFPDQCRVSDTIAHYLGQFVNDGHAGGGQANAFRDMRDGARAWIRDRNAEAETGVTHLAWQPVAGAERYYVYRRVRAGGAWEWRQIGFAAAPATAFIDNQLSAAGKPGLSSGGNPFLEPGDWPGVAAFYEQRLVLGRTDRKPTTFWGSRTGAYQDFGHTEPDLRADDSYEFTLDEGVEGGQVNEIVWLAGMQSLLVGTAGCEARAGGNQPLTPLSPDVRPQSWHGGARLPALAAGRSVLYAGRSRRVVRDLFYDLSADGFRGDDLTLFAGHLFEEARIVSMAWQPEPDSLLWTVLEDGTLLTCTYLPDQRVASWSRHDTARGKFRAVATLPGRDGRPWTCFAVERETRVAGLPAVQWFLEAIERPLSPPADARDAWHVDCGLSTDTGQQGGSGETLESTEFTGLDHLEGMAVAVLADGVPQPLKEVSGGKITLDHPARQVTVGLPVEAELETLDLDAPGRDGPSALGKARAIEAVSLRFHRTGECQASHGADGTPWPDSGRWDDALRLPPGRSVPLSTELYTGPATLFPPRPPGGQSTRLRLRSHAPVPCAILSIRARASSGAETR